MDVLAFANLPCPAEAGRRRVQPLPDKYYRFITALFLSTIPDGESKGINYSLKSLYASAIFLRAESSANWVCSNDIVVIPKSPILASARIAPSNFSFATSFESRCSIFGSVGSPINLFCYPPSLKLRKDEISERNLTFLPLYLHQREDWGSSRRQ